MHDHQKGCRLSCDLLGVSKNLVYSNVVCFFDTKRLPCGKCFTTNIQKAIVLTTLRELRLGEAGGGRQCLLGCSAVPLQPEFSQNR